MNSKYQEIHSEVHQTTYHQKEKNLPASSLHHELKEEHSQGECSRPAIPEAQLKMIQKTWQGVKEALEKRYPEFDGQWGWQKRGE